MSYKGIEEKDQEKFAADVINARQMVAGKHSKKYTPPATKEAYWAVVDEYWDELLALMIQFTLIVDVDQLTKLKIDRDTHLVTHFNNAWFAAPDHGSIHLLPAWNVLCDLCSESYLVYED